MHFMVWRIVQTSHNFMLSEDFQARWPRFKEGFICCLESLYSSEKKMNLCLGANQGLVNQKGVGTLPKNSQFETASNAFQSKTWKKCGNAVPTRSRYFTSLVLKRLQPNIHPCETEHVYFKIIKLYFLLALMNHNDFLNVISSLRSVMILWWYKSIRN